MAETSEPTNASAKPTDGKGRLETDRGTTTIAEVVVTKVAGIAARLRFS